MKGAPSRCPRCPKRSFGHADEPGARFLGGCVRVVLSFVRCEVDPTTLMLELTFCPGAGASSIHSRVQVTVRIRNLVCRPVRDGSDRVQTVLHMHTTSSY
jgi:hypothetical protein